MEATGWALLDALAVGVVDAAEVVEVVVVDVVVVETAAPVVPAVAD